MSSNLPNATEAVKIYQNEYVSNTTINRPLSRLVANDEYLESIIKNYLNIPVLPFVDRLYPADLSGIVVEKEWMVGDALSDRALTFNVTISDGDNTRYSTVKLINNEDGTISVSDTYHESPHIIGLIELEFYTNSDDKIMFKLKSSNSSMLKIMGEVTTVLPKDITSKLASRYQYYLQQEPALFVAYHSHPNGIEALNNIIANPAGANKYKFLNAQGEYTKILFNTPTSHNHEHLELLEKLKDNIVADPSTVFNSLTRAGSGNKFLSDDGTYVIGAQHSHGNKSSLDLITLDISGLENTFMNKRGNFINIAIDNVHTHEFDSVSHEDALIFIGETNELINGNKTAIYSILGNLSISGDTNNYLSEAGTYEKLHTHLNKDAIDSVQKTVIVGDQDYFLNKQGSYAKIDSHTHTNTQMSIFDAFGSADADMFLNGEGQYKRIDSDVFVGGMILDTSDPSTNPDPPDRYFWCDGSLKSKAMHQTLYHKIGIRWGENSSGTKYRVPTRADEEIGDKICRWAIKYTSMYEI